MMRQMKSANVKRSITLRGHLTSISLEEDFWLGLKEIAETRSMSVPELVSRIDSERQQVNL
jgi:predicted DNA-binding ribbon-helix-helix protein